jgi:thiamine transporter
MSTRELARMALYVALFVALDWISGTMLPRMPQGGSLGLSTIVLLIASFDLGVGKALIVTIVGLLLGFMTDPPFFLHFVQYFLDYVVGYTAYAFGRVLLSPNGDEKSFWYYLLPIFVPNLVRFLSSSLAGVLYYEVGWIASFGYQAGYIVPTVIASMIILPLLYVRIKPILKK